MVIACFGGTADRDKSPSYMLFLGHWTGIINVDVLNGSVHTYCALNAC